MLPSALEAFEIEALLRCVELCLYHRLLTVEEEDDVESACEKLKRYLRDENCWHGVRT